MPSVKYGECATIGGHMVRTRVHPFLWRLLLLLLLLRIVLYSTSKAESKYTCQQQWRQWLSGQYVSPTIGLRTNDCNTRRLNTKLYNNSILRIEGNAFVSEKTIKKRPKNKLLSKKDRLTRTYIKGESVLFSHCARVGVGLYIIQYSDCFRRDYSYVYAFIHIYVYI